MATEVRAICARANYLASRLVTKQTRRRSIISEKITFTGCDRVERRLSCQELPILCTSWSLDIMKIEKNYGGYRLLCCVMQLVLVQIHVLYIVTPGVVNFTLLAQSSHKTSHLSMLFILDLTCTVNSAGQIKNKWH